MILYVELIRFYARTAAPEDSPVIVHHEKRVWDTSRAAQKAGIQIGMPLTQARAIVPEAKLIAYLSEDYEQAQKAWLDLAVEYSGKIEPIAQHAAFLDLSEQNHPEELVEHFLAELEGRLSWKAKAALSPTKWLAQLAAQSQDPIAIQLGLCSCEVVDDPPAHLQPLQTEYLLPVAPEHRQRLIFLGYRTIGDVAKAPLEVLRGQFGDAGNLILQSAQGRSSEIVLALYPPRSLQKRFRFESPIESLEALNLGLQNICVKLGHALVERDLQGTDLWLYIEPEEGPIERLERRFAKPAQTATGLLAFAKLLMASWLEARQEFSPITAIRLILPNLTKANRKQQTFATLISTSERQNRAQAVLQTLKSSLGEQSILTASEVEEPRRKKILRMWREATGWY